MNFDYSIRDSALCFDAEMVDEQRLIELSIFNLAAQETYHSYYNPGQVKAWREEIHHISRDTVKDAPAFARERGRVQRLLDRADFIIGCAISNDTGALRHHGIKGLDRKRVLEVQAWYWYLFDFEQGESLYRTRSLLAIAEALGIDFDETTAHGASADTAATLSCFLRLAGIFAEREGLPETVSLAELADRFDERFAVARHDFLEREARGFVQLIRRDNDYTLKFNQKVEKPHSRTIEMIEVADRFIAEYELRKLFAKRQDRERADIYHLKPVDIERFKEYANAFDEERSAYCRSLASTRLSRATTSINIRF